MKIIKEHRQVKENLLLQLHELTTKYLQFETLQNFFTKLEEESKEEIGMKKRLQMLLKFQEENFSGGGKKKQLGARKQSYSEFNHFLKRKNIMEAKVFKKRYERVDKYISGIPKPIGGINKEYRPSIYNDEVVDPKVDIPSNKAIFNNVIKTKKSEDQDDDEEDDKKVFNEDEQIEKELQAIKDKISNKISKLKDVN